jgi:hypothetical protein
MNIAAKNITTHPLLRIWFMSIVMNSLVAGIWMAFDFTSDDSNDYGEILMLGGILSFITFIINVLLSAPGLFIFLQISKFIISQHPDNFHWRILVVNLSCILSTFFILLLCIGFVNDIRSSLAYILKLGIGGTVISSILILTLRKNKIFITAEQNV